MKTKLNAFLLIVSLPFLCWAQPKFPILGVKVIKNGTTLSNPWVGGFNNPIFSPIDLNEDGLMDMFVYDKAGWKAMAFINTGSPGHVSYTYAPQYDVMFPKDIRSWALIRDYNCDGIGDIFALRAGSNSDIIVYKGARNGNVLSYTQVSTQLRSGWLGGTTNIWTFADNLPVIMDVDGDGDLDILTPNISAGSIDYYQNQAAENHYSCDSLTFYQPGGCWGNFTFNGQGDGKIFLHANCKRGGGGGGASRHQGCNIFGWHYHRNSHVTDLLFGDIHINTLDFLENFGDTSYANIGYDDTLFPHYNVPVKMFTFPAAYGMDVNNDGFDDFLISPYATNISLPDQSEDINTVKYYRNRGGTDSVNKFDFQGDLLTPDIIDVGTQSHPMFFDFNGDGLMDIVVGNYGRLDSPGNPIAFTSGRSRSFLTLYQNIGSDTVPVYQLADTNWCSLQSFHLRDVYPAFGDLDGDGKADMVVGDFTGHVHFFKNTGTNIAAFPAMNNLNWFNLAVGFSAKPFIFDVDHDGLNDLVIGSSGLQSPNGSHIYYYRNFGTATAPQFSPDSVNSFFGKVMVWDNNWSQEGDAAPFLMQEAGHTVLYVGSWNGIIHKYLVNPDSLRTGSFMEVDSDVLRFHPGNISTVSIADINHDGKNDYLVGNVRGGLMMFSDTVWSGRAPSAIADVVADNAAFEAFPNPARDLVICRLSKGEQHLQTAVLYDMLGKMVGTQIVRNDETGVTLNTANVPDGIYLVEATDQNGKNYQHKIVIMK